ncbi:MAG: type IV pilin-like G/H family protein [Cyanobacteria bacterium P01_G01_bin.54]
MQKDLRIKFLNFLNSRKQNSEAGFTLIELLVVIIIIGILAAIALPSLLGQASKAKQSEARNNVGALCRGQQAFALEANAYSSDIESLGLGIPPETVNYQYHMVGTATADDTDPTFYIQQALVAAAPRVSALKPYLCPIGTGTVNDDGSGEVLTVSAVFEGLKPRPATQTTEYGAPGAPTEANGNELIKIANQPAYADQEAGQNGWKALGK